MRRNSVVNIIITALIATAVVVLDQVTKLLVLEHLAGAGTYPLIENILHFTYVENRGAAFGMLANHRWVFMVLSVVGILAISGWLIAEKPKSLWIRTAISFVIGGGIGNMIDRVRLGYVVDFIDCRFIDFYVFNVADSFVCVGCAMFLLGVLWDEMRTKKAAALQLPAEEKEESHE